MFRTFAQASFRRSLHTSTARSASTPTRARAVLAASAVATSYFVWSSWYGQRIALDAAPSASKSKQVPLTPKTAASPEAIAHSDATAPQHEPSLPHGLKETPDASKGEPKPESEGDAEESSGGTGGAYNPETGEINWDCPCLGGMAHGPCGPQFREAFSCFIYSEADPKGLDCVEKFKIMQQCFREHPEVYGEDHLRDDDDDEEEFASSADVGPATGGAVVSPTEPAPSVPAPELAEAQPTPVEQKIKPRKVTAPATQ